MFSLQTQVRFVAMKSAYFSPYAYTSFHFLRTLPLKVTRRTSSKVDFCSIYLYKPVQFTQYLLDRAHFRQQNQAGGTLVCNSESMTVQLQLNRIHYLIFLVSDRKIRITHSPMVSQRFQGYHCEFDLSNWERSLEIGSTVPFKENQLTQIKYYKYYI